MAEATMTDLTQDRATLKTLYAPPKGRFTRVDVPDLPFAVLDGKGPPEPTSIAAAIKTLYTAIYALRREARSRTGSAFVEAPVEILYWADDMRDLAAGRRDKWRWRVQITLPVWADAQQLEQSVALARGELGDAPSPRWEAFSEGPCVQCLHVGLSDDIPALLDTLYNTYLPQERLEPSAAYHEIYLDDWNRVAPTQRKIILRQSVRQMTYRLYILCGVRHLG